MTQNAANVQRELWKTFRKPGELLCKTMLKDYMKVWTFGGNIWIVSVSEMNHTWVPYVSLWVLLQVIKPCQYTVFLTLTQYTLLSDKCHELVVHGNIMLKNCCNKDTLCVCVYVCVHMQICVSNKVTVDNLGIKVAFEANLRHVLIKIVTDWLRHHSSLRCHR